MNAAPVTKMEYWYFVVFNLFVIYNLIHSLLGCFQCPFFKERIKKQGESRPINGKRSLLLLPLSPLLKSYTRSALQIFEEKMILVKEDICNK